MDIFSYFSAGMEAPWFTSYLFIRTCLEYTPNLILACLTVYQSGLGWGGVELGAWKCMDYTEFIVLWAYIKVFHDLKHYFVISGRTWIIGGFVPPWPKMVIGWWWCLNVCIFYIFHGFMSIYQGFIVIWNSIAWFQVVPGYWSFCPGVTESGQWSKNVP